MAVQKVWNHSDGNNLASFFIDNFANIAVFHTHDILTIYFQQFMFNQKTIFGGGRVHNDSRNFTIFELKTNMTGRILVQGQGSFKWPVPNSQNNIVDSSLFEDRMYFFGCVSSNGFVIDLKYLIAKLQTAHGSRTLFSHQSHKNALVDSFNPKANFTSSISAQDHLTNAMSKLGL